MVWCAFTGEVVQVALDPANAEAKSIKAQALIAIGREQISANARNYFMTSAMQLGATPPKFK